MFFRKDATKHLVMRVDDLIRKTTIYAKIAFNNDGSNPLSHFIYLMETKVMKGIFLCLNILELVIQWMVSLVAEKNKTTSFI
jgi:hypothetical protein